MEKIISGAVRFSITGATAPIIMKCHRHCDVFETLHDLHIDYDRSSVEQGFIAYEPIVGERFVDRVEAARIAHDAAQMTLRATALYTEDLW